MVESMAKSASAFGMIGTLIGLVFMMISMNPQDPTFSGVGQVEALLGRCSVMFAMICNPLLTSGTPQCRGTILQCHCDASCFDDLEGVVLRIFRSSLAGRPT